MDMERFGEAFSRHTHFRANRFHPLVWINGEPEIGENVYIGGLSEVNAKHCRVRIGDNCDIASFVSINCADSHRKSIGLADEVDRREIILEENVFVGSHSVIKGGAHIGHHSVVAAGTMVEGRKIPPYSLVIGNPMIVKEGYYLKAENRLETVPHNRPTLGREEEQAAARVVRSGWLAQGGEVRALEDGFCAFLGLEPGHAVAVSSGTAALFLALEILGAAGRKTAMPAYVCAALRNACLFAKAEPLLLDNAPGSPNLDPAALRRSGAQIAIVPHMYGIPLDLDGVEGMVLIEDCAQALGASVKGVPVGLRGDAGVFSFYATKLMTSGGQGGMLVCRDRALADAARDFREFDQRHDRKARFNLQMTDLQAAIGREQLKKLPGFLEKRRLLSGLYRSHGLDLLAASGEGLEPAWYRAVLRTGSPAKVIAALESIGVRAINPLEEWELLGDAADYPNASALCRTTVSLPLYPSLSESDARRIAEKVKST
ncbi:MAG TPA: DegT/DnrJ/EryC1/StrS family aminotransferase [Fibrobacteria bacterium]|nr:DegT/DnrJ/EryC1/StrS family aminotransferase [Fibrobacteria bacterium]